MNKKFLFPIFFIAIIGGVFLFKIGGMAQVSQGRGIQTVNYKDYYKFGSVTFSKSYTSSQDRSDYTAGKTISFSVTLTNNNAYPIADGMVFAKIYRQNSENPENNFLVDQFAAVKGVNMWPLEDRQFTFTWASPENSVEGAYYADLSFQSSKQFNLSGLSFTPSVVGTSIGFNILQGAKAGFWFDDSNVVFNGTKEKITSTTSTVNEGGNASLSMHLISQLDSGNADVTLKLHPFDVIKGEEAVISKYTQIQKGLSLANKDQILNFTFQGLAPGAYVVEVKAVGEKQQAMSDYRFAVAGKKGRMIFAALDTFPLKEGQDFEMFSVFSNSADFYSSFIGKVVLELSDKQTKKTLAQSVWQGTIVSSPPIAGEESFKAQNNSGDLLLTAKLYDDKDNLMDQTQTEYNLANFTKPVEAKIPPSRSNTITVIIIIAVAIILAAIIIYLIKKNKIKKIKNFSSGLFSKIKENSSFKVFVIVIAAIGFLGVVYAYVYPIKTSAVTITGTCKPYVAGKVSQYARFGEAVNFVVDNVTGGSGTYYFSFSDPAPGLSCVQNNIMSSQCIFSSDFKTTYKPTVAVTDGYGNSGSVKCLAVIVTDNPPTDSSPVFVADPTGQPCLTTIYNSSPDLTPPFYLQVENLSFSQTDYSVQSDGVGVSQDIDNPTKICDYNCSVSVRNTGAIFRGDWIPNTGGYMDTPSVNWVKAYPRAVGDPQCPDSLTGPDAGIDAYYNSVNLTSSKCPQKICNDPSHTWTGAVDPPGTGMDSSKKPSCGGTFPYDWINNFDASCDACAQYQDKQAVVSDKYFGLKNNIAKVQLYGAKYTKKMCAEIQLNCERTMSVSVNGPARVVLSNNDSYYAFPENCTACDPSDAGNTSNGGNECQSICSFNDIGIQLTNGSLTNNSQLNVKLRALGTPGMVTMTLIGNFDCFLYLDRDFYLNSSGLLGWEAGRFPFRLDSPDRFGFIQKTYYFDVSDCCK